MFISLPLISVAEIMSGSALQRARAQGTPLTTTGISKHVVHIPDCQVKDSFWAISKPCVWWCLVTHRQARKTTFILTRGLLWMYFMSWNYFYCHNTLCDYIPLSTFGFLDSVYSFFTFNILLNNCKQGKFSCESMGSLWKPEALPEV